METTVFLYEWIDSNDEIIDFIVLDIRSKCNTAFVMKGARFSVYSGEEAELLLKDYEAQFEGAE